MKLVRHTQSGEVARVVSVSSPDTLALEILSGPHRGLAEDVHVHKFLSDWSAIQPIKIT